MSRAPRRAKRKEPSQERAQETVRIILLGASEVLEARGLKGATMARIAERAGVSVGSVYQYFSTKSELLDAVVAFRLDAIEHAMIGVITAAEDGHFLDTLDDAIAAVVAHLIEDIALLHIIAAELYGGDAMPLIDNIGSRVRTHLTQVLSRELPDHDPEELGRCARVLIGAHIGILLTVFRDDPSLLLDPSLHREMATLTRRYVSPLFDP